MIPYRNCEIFASVLFFFAIKIFCSIIVWYRNMYKKSTLACIPERNETEDELRSSKWVPKKKHEVLKAKYKCLKKLFQIYDASVIGILPEANPGGFIEEEVKNTKKRKKRSHRTTTDACAGTSENLSGDLSSNSKVSEKNSVATIVLKDLKMNHCSCSSREESVASNHKYAGSCVSNEKNDQQCECIQTIEPHPIPYLIVSEKKKPTRFQIFIQRIFGMCQDRSYKNYTLPNGHVYAASDNMIPSNFHERRRRRGLRFRRLRRPKNIQSEMNLTKNPNILNYVQTVQRSCLMDTTPRQCPINGCRMVSYGIINYNDHLNLCHFRERKHICHYCHEGFENEHDKLVHENEHIGISKLQQYPTTSHTSTTNTRQSCKKASNTQIDQEVTNFTIPEEKLKKILSFFDKINDADHILTSIKNRSSETYCQRAKSGVLENGSIHSDKRSSASYANLQRRVCTKTLSVESDQSSQSRASSCKHCGGKYYTTRRLSDHSDSQHKTSAKFSKYHSCSGIINCPTHNRIDMVSEDGKIKVQSVDMSIRRYNSSTISNDSFSDVSRRRSEDSLSCDPSTNIVYYQSLENIKKPSAVNNFMQKVRSGFSTYKWEPQTKIIHV